MRGWVIGWNVGAAALVTVIHLAGPIYDNDDYLTAALFLAVYMSLFTFAGVAIGRAVSDAR